jgi:hypothetical protein
MQEEEFETGYFVDVYDLQGSSAAGQPAGIFWLDGRSVMATHASRAEQRLLDAGAILVATLMFERDPLESRYAGRSIERLSADASLALGAPVPN